LTSEVVAVGLAGAGEIRWDRGLYCLEGEAPKEEEGVKDLISV